MKFSTCVGVLFTAILALQMQAGPIGFARKARKALQRVWRERNARDNIGQAIEEGRISAVEAFLDNGIDLNSYPGSEELFGCLYFAKRLKQVDIIRLLVERGADVTDLHMRLFRFVARSGDESLMRLLIERGVNIHDMLLSPNGRSALHWAVSSKSEQILPLARLLIEQGANMNESELGTFGSDVHQWTPLHCAAREGNEQLVRLLIESGAEVNVQDSDQFSPLNRALVPVGISGQGPRIHNNPYQSYFEERDKKNDYKGGLYSRSGRLAVVALLIENGAEVYRFGSVVSPLDLVLQQCNSAFGLLSKPECPYGSSVHAVERERIQFLRSVAHGLAAQGENWQKMQDLNPDLIPLSFLDELTRIYQNYRQQVLLHLQEHFPKDLCNLILDMG